MYQDNNILPHYDHKKITYIISHLYIILWYEILWTLPLILAILIYAYNITKITWATKFAYSLKSWWY